MSVDIHVNKKMYTNHIRSTKYLKTLFPLYQDEWESSGDGDGLTVSIESPDPIEPK